MLLAEYTESAIRAFNGTSFDPEKRGERTIKDHSQELVNDLEEVTQLGGDPDEYTSKYKRYFSAWLSARSRCISAAITGPARIPTAKADKADRSEHNRYNDLVTFRANYIKQLRRKKEAEKRRNIDPIQELKDQLEAAEKNQGLMTAANKIVRKKGATTEQRVLALIEIGFDEATAKNILVPYSWGHVGFARYQLTNNNAKIKRMRERLAALEKRAATKPQEVERPDGVRVVSNTEIDRLQIFFPGKPSADVIAKLKAKAFKWSPTNGCWQRQLTGNAIYAYKQILQ